jgi:hypothetical protein
VVTAGDQPQLDIAGPLRNRLADREHDVELSPTLRDRAHVGKVAAGVASLQIHGHAGRRSPIDDEPGA